MRPTDEEIDALLNECGSLRTEIADLNTELKISADNLRLALAEIATLREGRDLARQAGAELVEEVRALREVLGERSRDLHWSEHKDFDEYRNRVGPLACQREPCATDRRLTQEERDG